MCFGDPEEDETELEKDMRKRSVHQAYLRSGFKTQAMCVPSLIYEMAKEEVSYSLFTFFFKNIPLLVI